MTGGVHDQPDAISPGNGKRGNLPSGRQQAAPCVAPLSGFCDSWRRSGRTSPSPPRTRTRGGDRWRSVPQCSPPLPRPYDVVPVQSPEAQPLNPQSSQPRAILRATFRSGKSSLRSHDGGNFSAVRPCAWPLLLGEPSVAPGVWPSSPCLRAFCEERLAPSGIFREDRAHC